MNRIQFRLLVAVCLMCSSFQLGCVQRRILVQSQPEGALVTIDDQTIGHTPVSVPFTYYGTRVIRLEKDGYETVEVKEPIKPPFYQIPPLSFFADNFALREIRDVRAVNIELPLKKQTNEDQLIQRGTQLRQEVWQNSYQNQ